MSFRGSAKGSVREVAGNLLMVLILLTMVFSSFHLGPTTVRASATEGRANSGDMVPRTVLGEMFTATWCVPCINADAGISNIVNDSAYFDSRFVLIEYHSSDNYSIAEGAQRSNYYLINSIPAIMFDGQDKVTGSSGTSEQNEADYKSHIDSAPNTADITVKAWMELNGGTGKVTINATVQHTLGLADVGLVINAVIVEDHKERAPTGHFLRMTAVEMPINAQATTIHNQGSSMNVTHSFDINGTWDQSKLAVVAWVQNENSREVLQSGIAYPANAQPPQNMPPQYVGGDLDFSMEEDTVDTHIDVSSVFKDPDGDKLTYTSEGSTHIGTSIDPGHKLSVSPAQQWYGTETIYISAKDPYHPATTSSIAVTVKEVDQPPQLKGKLTGLTFDEDMMSTTSPLSSIFTDPEGDPIRYTIGPTIHVKVIKNPDTTLTLTPTADWNGDENLVVVASDGTYDTTYQDTIVVKPVNDPPVITAHSPKDENPQVKEGDSILISVTASDVEGASLTYKWEVDGSPAGAGMSTFKYEPQYGDAGDRTVTVEVRDGELTATHTFHVNVLQGNRPPTVSITSPSAGAEFDTGASITFIADVSDPDDVQLRHIEFMWTVDGQAMSTDLEFTSKLSSGSHTVTLKVSDGEFERADSVSFSVKEKAGNGVPGFEAWAMSLALVAALALMAFRRKA